MARARKRPSSSAPDPRTAARGTAAPLLACVDVPNLPLQILRRDRPDVAARPLAVVAEDRPDAPLTHVDDRARRLRLRTGMRFGEAKNLVPGLFAAVVPKERVDETVEELVTALQTFSPRVEADDERPGTFYVDPSGLGRIYGDTRNWAHAVDAYLKGRGLSASVAVARGRFAAYALSKAGRRVTIAASRSETRQRLEVVPLEALALSPRLRDDLAALSVKTVGDLLGLPAGELRSRFGAEAARLQALAAEDAQLPMQPRSFDEPLTATLEIEPPDMDHARLLFGIKGALHELLTAVASRSLLLRALHITLTLEGPGSAAPSGGGGSRPIHEERIEPATPSRDAMLILDLVRLRLAEVALPGPVEAITLAAETSRATGEQLTLLRLGPKRDLAAGERALARVRAAFGPDAVACARLRDAHLPEARFAFERVDKLRLAKLRDRKGRGGPPAEPQWGLLGQTEAGESVDRAPPPMTRRVLRRPRPLATRNPDEPGEGPLLGNGAEVKRLFGPYRVSGGWWVRTVERDYYYAETETGELLWVYWDRPRRRWYLHGVVD